MSGIVQQISGVLPELRRYARALTGCREIGDRWIAGCLEALLEDREQISAGGDLKFEMFRLLQKEARRFVYDAHLLFGAEPQDRLEREILGLPLLDRQILLLATLEGFAPEQVAQLTELSVAEITVRLTAVRQRLGAVVSGRVLIIEDEPIVAMDLVNVVRSAGHVLAGVAPTNRRALELARDRTPDLILADVHLRSGESGIATIKQILQTGSLPVIFVTGYPERVLTREGIEPSLLIAKPFDPKVLGLAINQAVSGGLPAARQRQVAS